MRPLFGFASLALAITSILSVAACGSESQPSGGSGGMDDGKVHPPGNGMHQSQADACDALSQAQDAKNQALACIATSRPCPQLVLVQVGGTECLEYDQGSVQGCVDYYAQQTTCEALAKAIDDCVVTTFPDSAPNGCP